MARQPFRFTIRRNLFRNRRVVRDRARRGLAILPSLLTLGNMLCGFFAIVRVASVQWSDGAPTPVNAFRDASLAILLAMVFDMLDGRVARMTRTTSDFGGQLDSLADAVTFGVAPGVLVAMTHSMARYASISPGGYPFWSKMAWVFGAAYAAGAVIRLARFNVQNSHDDEAHLSFKGLPSPAAAGVIATVALLSDFLLSPRANVRLSWIQPTLVESLGHRLLDLLPFVALGAGYLMVSTFRYVHVANRFLRGRKPFDYLAGALFLGVLVALFPEVSAAVAFCGYALTGPVLALRRWMAGPGEAPAAQGGEARASGSGRLQPPRPADEAPLGPSHDGGGAASPGPAR